MLIEIRGTGTHNKGAELMAQTILQQFKALAPKAQFASERWFGSWDERASYGLRTMLPENGVGRAAIVSRLMSKSFRFHYGVVLRSDLDSVLDASGFAYGDQWGPEPTEDSAAIAEQCKRRGVPYILMPQAFGPFTSDRIRSAATRLIKNSTLVFPREGTSHNHLRGLGVDHPGMTKSHDFTVLSKGELPDPWHMPEEFGCIVPNVRMLDKASESSRLHYVDFLVTCVHELQRREIKPVFLYHDPKNDSKVAEQVNRKLGRPVEVISYHCPKMLKAVIGQSRVVIGSRFHALVGALCQGVPVVATSWSHKYEELLAEYGVPELLLKPGESKLTAPEVLTLVLDEPRRSETIRRLTMAADEFRKQSLDVFKRIAECLNLAVPS